MLRKALPTSVRGLDRRPIVIPHSATIESRHRVALEIGLPFDIRDLLGIARCDFIAKDRLLVQRLNAFDRRFVGRWTLRSSRRLRTILRRRGRFGAGLVVVLRCRVLAFCLGLLLDIRFFEDRIFLKFLLHEVHELELIQLQQLDRLLQLRRHHQLLRQSKLLSQFERHEFPSQSTQAGRARFPGSDSTSRPLDEIS